MNVAAFVLALISFVAPPVSAHFSNLAFAAGMLMLVPVILLVILPKRPLEVSGDRALSADKARQRIRDILSPLRPSICAEPAAEHACGSSIAATEARSLRIGLQDVKSKLEARLLELRCEHRRSKGAIFRLLGFVYEFRVGLEVLAAHPCSRETLDVGAGQAAGHLLVIAVQSVEKWAQKPLEQLLQDAPQDVRWDEDVPGVFGDRIESAITDEIPTQLRFLCGANWLPKALECLGGICASLRDDYTRDVQSLWDNPLCRPSNGAVAGA